MKLLYIFIFSSFFILNSCSKVRESAGVTRKSIDEFQVVENPPLVIPPDFNLLPPDQLKEKNIDDIEKEFAEEILFGLDENEIKTQTQLSTMNQILSEANALELSLSIKDEIDLEFSQEISTKTLSLDNWKNEDEVLDALSESNKINNIDNEDIKEKDKDSLNKKTKIRKKKRFFFF